MSVADDRWEIEQVKYRYLRAVDTRDWAAFTATLTPDVQAGYGSKVNGQRLTFDGRAALVAYLREAMPPTMVTEHRVTHPMIEVTGDVAEGTWYLQDKVMVPEYDVLILGAAFYRDTYRRTPEGWRISATAYDRTFEATGTLSAAGLTVTPGPAIIGHRAPED